MGINVNLIFCDEMFDVIKTLKFLPPCWCPYGWEMLKACEMLKAAVVGVPSLVFTHKHVAGQTRIRSHKYDLARIVKRIVGFDANSLYPSTMAKEMPCGKEFVEHYEDPVQAAKDLIPRMYSKRWFGFAEVDLEVPQDLWEKFEEFPSIFINQSVGEEGIPQHMKDYLAKSGRTATPNQMKLLGVLKAKKVLTVRSSCEVVLRARARNHGCTSNDRLYSTKDPRLVRARSSQHAK